MTTPDRYRLLAGPYRPPRVRPGRKAYCNFRGCEVKVTTMTAARIPWPRCQVLGQQGGSGLLVDDELRRAIESESAAALAYWWGVSGNTVWAWRRAFGIERAGTPGSHRLVQAAAKLGADAIKAREWSPAERRRRSRNAKRLNLAQYLPADKAQHGRAWTVAELRMLGTMPDADLAKRIGRTETAVRVKRGKFAI